MGIKMDLNFEVSYASCFPAYSETKISLFEQISNSLSSWIFPFPYSFFY